MIYERDYRKQHSIFLREHFPVRMNGIDWHNENNIGIEFKESFRKDEKKICYRISKYESEIADLLVCTIKSREFYVIDMRDIKENYSLGYKDNFHVRINSIKNLAIFQTNNIDELEFYLDNYER